jgi:hypothetical protein
LWDFTLISIKHFASIICCSSQNGHSKKPIHLRTQLHTYESAAAGHDGVDIDSNGNLSNSAEFFFFRVFLLLLLFLASSSFPIPASTENDEKTRQKQQQLSLPSFFKVQQTASIISIIASSAIIVSSLIVFVVFDLLSRLGQANSHPLPSLSKPNSPFPLRFQCPTEASIAQW